MSRENCDGVLESGQSMCCMIFESASNLIAGIKTLRRDTLLLICGKENTLCDILW